MYNKVSICGVNTSKLKVLTESEKKELLKKTKQGDKKAREELINGNLKLVLSVIRSFSNRNENPDDLFQVGCIGLIKAIDNFDISHDVRFSTYAVPMIIGELRRYLRDYNPIRVPRSMRDLAYRALKSREKLSALKSNEPTVEEIAKDLGEKTSSVASALDAILEPVSLFEPVYSDNGDSVFVLDQVKDESADDEEWTDRIAIKNAMDSLCEREKKILLMRYFSGKTQTEVSQEIGISQAQVSRLEKNALLHVRKRMS